MNANFFDESKCLEELVSNARFPDDIDYVCRFNGTHHPGGIYPDKTSIQLIGEMTWVDIQHLATGLYLDGIYTDIHPVKANQQALWLRKLSQYFMSQGSSIHLWLEDSGKLAPSVSPNGLAVVIYHNPDEADQSEAIRPREARIFLKEFLLDLERYLAHLARAIPDELNARYAAWRTVQPDQG